MSHRRRMMNRREFTARAGLAAAGLAGAGPWAAAGQTGKFSRRVRWTSAATARLFRSVACDGEPLTAGPDGQLLSASCRLWSEPRQRAVLVGPERPSAKHGPLQIELKHQLRNSGGGLGDDVLEATLTLRNASEKPQEVEAAFVTSASPRPDATEQRLYLPLSASGLSGDRRFEELGVRGFLKDCAQAVDSGEFECHYLEPQASHPDQTQTRALLLAPVVDIGHPSGSWHVALFGRSDQAVRFGSTVRPGRRRLWRLGRVLSIPAGQTVQEQCWLMVHRGDASAAWRAFHRFGHHEAYPPIGWIRDFKVHYYDFLSSAAGKEGHRGDGYDAAVPWFRTFHVGLATQHGYYPVMGDYIHPGRASWLAMQSDKHGPAEMSIETVKARIAATRKAGAKAGIYMHLTAMDDASGRFYPALAGGRRVGADGKPMRYPWNGPDVKGRLWWMSMACPRWRAHLLQQAEWILDILEPDAICVDETFCGMGYDHAESRRGAISPHTISFLKELHDLVRSDGRHRALFTSDCSQAGFSLWADGEVGDHAYSGLLGNPLYRQEPVRYLAALGQKPWRPCAWQFRRMWKHQMALARQVGSGVGVSNGWLEYGGLHGLADDERRRLIQDIETLL